MTRARGGRLCPGCASGLIDSMGTGRCLVCRHPQVAGNCPDCAAQAPAFDRLIAVFDYVGVGAELIRLYKVQRRLHLSAILADALATAVKHCDPPISPSTILVPVPARHEGIIQRGFSPAAEVARGLSARLRLPCRPDLLHRSLAGTKQAALGRRARLGALEGVYRCGPVPRGAHIAVVDDVLTTGSTLHHIARLLKAQGAATVTGMVLARALSRVGQTDELARRFD
ncbi:ComF family protein [Alcaligenaceae bacterium CGII-47]|nr:ComF family protein [Alcaligenaceae bacterium CGII-47]